MHIVIMAGGLGTRFWPVSRAARPKQFLRIVGEKPMIVATYERVKALASDRQIILAIGKEHRAETEQLFSGTDVRILAEPFGRNTAPCIGVCAGLINHLGSNEPVVILPADHYIARPDLFLESLRSAAKIASHGGIVTLGIVPTRPEKFYGDTARDARVNV